MIGRDRRYGRGRQVSLKAKAGIATAVLVGGGAIGVAAAASSHSSTSASNAGYQFRQHHASWQTSQNQLLAQLLTTNNQATVLNNLANLTSVRSFVQVRAGRQVLAAQRGVVLAASRNLLLVESANNGAAPTFHVWATGRARFTNATTQTQLQALLANLAAARAAMVGNMTPAVNTVANTGLVNQLVTTPANTQTTTVNIAGTGVTITVTVRANNTMTMNTFTNGRLTNRTQFLNLLAAVRAAQNRNAIAAGDMVVVAGTRVNGFLQARTVVFTPATAAGQPMGGTTTGGTTTGGTTTGGTTTNGAPAGQHT